MKITFLLTTADAMGGTERAVFTVAEALAGAHQVEVVSIFRTRRESFFSPRGLSVRYLVDNTGSVPRPVQDAGLDDAVYRQLAAQPSALVDPAWEGAFNRLSDLESERALRGIDSDVLVSSTPALQALMVQLAPPSVVLVGQEHRVSELRGASGAPLMIYTPRLDAMVALSEPTRDWFAESFGAAAPRLDVIGNALPDESRPGSALETCTITQAGRMVPEKQLDHAIKAFAKVAPANPRWRLRLLGDGPQLRQLRQLAVDLGVADQVQLVGRTRHMAEEWAQASICLLTSRVEAFGLVLAEAQAAGVPVVSYDCPNGPAEIVTHGVDGLLVPPGDLDGLAEALDFLMTDSAARHAYGAAALNAAERWTAAAVARRWDALLTELVAGRDSGRIAAERHQRTMRHEATLRELGVVTVEPAPAAPRGRVDQKAHEVRIEAASGGRVVRAGGQLHQVADDLSPFDVMRENLAMVVDLLEELEIPYWMTRTSMLRHSLATGVAYREEFLKALAERYRDQPVYASMLNPQGGTTHTVLAAVLDPARDGTAAGLRLFRPVSTTAGTMRLTGVYGCTVSFLARDEADPTVLPVAGDTIYGSTLPEAAMAYPASIRLHDRDYPTIEAFTRTLPTDIDFPIDAVYTWVDGNDPDWQARKAAVLEQHGFHAPVAVGAADDARFRDREELRYSLRSLDMYAPWIRTIYLVTDDQVPYWLDLDHPRIQVVSHRELFGDTGALPSFNSHAIESRLHRIEGLSEHFLYLNDDVFFGRALKPENFFHGSGQAKCFRSPTTIDPLPAQPEDEFALIAAKNNRELLERAFGRTPTNTFVHSPHALRRSVLAEIEQNFPYEVEQTARAQLRSAGDLAIASSLHHYYGLFTGRSVLGSISCGFINVGLREHHSRLGRLLSTRNNDVFCINDYHDADTPAEEQADILAVFLPSYFPVPSQFELGTVRNERLAHAAQ